MMLAQRTPPAETFSLTMPVLLEQLSQELGALQLMAADMEATVDDMIERHAGVLDARSIQNLQLLDILNQTLLALSLFAANASDLSSASWVVEGKKATAGITLASLAQRLARGRSAAAHVQAESYELFSDG